jgi:sulfopyruvate decarboxylase subunit alpha
MPGSVESMSLKASGNRLRTVPKAGSLQILDALARAGCTFAASVPDKGLDVLLTALDHDPRFIHVHCTREEEAIGLAAGAFLGGRRGVVLTQNSGLGNSVNALTSLIAFYELPLLLFVAMRGGPGERISAQVPMAKATAGVLEAAGVSSAHPSTLAAFADTIASWTSGCTAIIASPEAWSLLVED